MSGKSAERYTIKLPGGRFEAVMRPPTFDEVRELFLDGDGIEQKVRLFDMCAVETPTKLTAAAKRSIATRLLDIAGNDLTAEYVSEHDLEDDAAATELEKARTATGKEYVCLDLEARTYVFVVPDEPAVERFSKSKRGKGAGDIMLDWKLVETHCLYGDLDTLRLQRPIGIAELCRKLLEYCGLSLEAFVKKA